MYVPMFTYYADSAAKLLTRFTGAIPGTLPPYKREQ